MPLPGKEELARVIPLLKRYNVTYQYYNDIDRIKHDIRVSRTRLRYSEEIQVLKRKADTDKLRLQQEQWKSFKLRDSLRHLQAEYNCYERECAESAHRKWEAERVAARNEAALKEWTAQLNLKYSALQKLQESSKAFVTEANLDEHLDRELSKYTTDQGPARNAFGMEPLRESPQNEILDTEYIVDAGPTGGSDMFEAVWDGKSIDAKKREEFKVKTQRTKAEKRQALQLKRTMEERSKKGRKTWWERGLERQDQERKLKAAADVNKKKLATPAALKAK